MTKEKNRVEVKRAQRDYASKDKKVTMTISISPDNFNRITDFCYAMNINRSVFMGRAAEKYLQMMFLNEGE